MMSTATEKRKKRTEETETIQEHLRKHFPSAEVYRYNIASIRVRIIDEAFRGKSLLEREEMVAPLLKELPEDSQAEITVLLTLAPGEECTSMMNVEFEYPSPTSLAERP